MENGKTWPMAETILSYLFAELESSNPQRISKKIGGTDIEAKALFLLLVEGILTRLFSLVVCFLAGKHFVGGSLGYKRPNWGVPTGLSPPALVSHKSCRGPLIDFISEVLQYRRHPWWPLFVYLARRLAMHPESLRRACLVRMPSTTRIKATKGAKDFEKTWRCIRRFRKK